eukprot:1161882-Pelagomonas_calceolata.AAC.3
MIRADAASQDSQHHAHDIDESRRSMVIFGQPNINLLFRVKDNDANAKHSSLLHTVEFEKNVAILEVGAVLPSGTMMYLYLHGDRSAQRRCLGVLAAQAVTISALTCSS